MENSQTITINKKISFEEEEEETEQQDSSS